jgi:DNA-binding transcriptional LysR family regulator
VASKNHTFAKKKNIDLALLKNEKFIFREKGSGTRMTTDAHFKKLKFKADVRLELGNNEAIKQAVIGGLGLAVLSKYSLVLPTAFSKNNILLDNPYHIANFSNISLISSLPLLP